MIQLSYGPWEAKARPAAQLNTGMHVRWDPATTVTLLLQREAYSESEPEMSLEAKPGLSCMCARSLSVTALPACLPACLLACLRDFLICI